MILLQSTEIAGYKLLFFPCVTDIPPVSKLNMCGLGTVHFSRVIYPGQNDFRSTWYCASEAHYYY
jgi:hypothetical protein